ncbi:hypothetical protein RRG08_004824 [Elysia crispata]|uniref:Uncharacterized protein n=1 Tax=Elysia crispata TaxID=231223 RepID=A0AAE1CSQ3_9GAST|nr:hypothetical protein RRG08_004824 [Elysia crispata]
MNTHGACSYTNQITSIYGLMRNCTPTWFGHGEVYSSQVTSGALENPDISDNDITWYKVFNLVYCSQSDLGDFKEIRISAFRPKPSQPLIYTMECPVRIVALKANTL